MILESERKAYIYEDILGSVASACSSFRIELFEGMVTRKTELNQPLSFTEQLATFSTRQLLKRTPYCHATSFRYPCQSKLVLLLPA
ncbi:hypothetical protein M0804_011625 [Polistes exclamans]|nr:hypothetical protein M0804_011625 [Polistes exclamans]